MTCIHRLLTSAIRRGILRALVHAGIRFLNRRRFRRKNTVILGEITIITRQTGVEVFRRGRAKHLHKSRYLHR